MQNRACTFTYAKIHTYSELKYEIMPQNYCIIFLKKVNDYIAYLQPDIKRAMSKICLAHGF